MSTKTKSSLPDAPNSKAIPATPRIVKPSRGLAKSETNSVSPQLNSRPPVDKSPRLVTAKPSVEKRSPRLSTPPDKKPSRILKPSEIQAELNVVQEDLKKAKDKLIVVEKEKLLALNELKEAQRLTEETNEKLNVAVVAQKRAEENSEIEKFRSVQMEQAGIKAVQKKEEEWKKELEAVQNQHAQDVTALVSATEELARVKQELTITCYAKNQALIHAEDATKSAEIQADKVEKLAAEVGQLESLLNSRTEAVADENVQLVAGLKQEIESLRQELTRISDAKNQALSHADDAAKTAEHHAEEVRKLSAEMIHLKSLLDSKNEADAIENAKVVTELKLDIETLREEVEKSKRYEKKMIEYEATIEQFNIDLEAAKLAESYSHNLVEECRKRVEELEIQTSEAKQLEKSAIKSIESIMKQLKGSNDMLNDAESEILSLKEKVGSLEISMKRQKGDFDEAKYRLELAKEESNKMQEDVESLKSELEGVKEERNQALRNEQLAAASIQTLLEEKKGISLLHESEEKISYTLEEETFLRNSIKETESEVIYLKDILRGSKAESIQLKECLVEKENKLQNILQEKEELRARDVASLKKVEELTKLLEEASSRKGGEENDNLSESEKDYDMLPKVVEFSEQNGGGREEMSKFELVPQQHNQTFVPHIQEFNNILKKEAVKASSDTENSEDKPEDTEKKKIVLDETEKVEFKMWESCKIEEKDFSPEREQEHEAFEDDTEGCEILDHTNGLSSTDSISNGGTSPLKQQSQKKKRPLLQKFGSLLKKKGTSAQK